MRQEYLPVQDFLNSTVKGHYNELVYSNPEKFLPTYIIVNENDLANQEKMKIIAELSERFNLPLILIDTKCYESTCENRTKPITSNEFVRSGYTFNNSLRYNLEETKEKMKQSTVGV